MKTLLPMLLLTTVSNVQAHLIDTGSNTAEWHTQGVNISFSGVDDESCRDTFPTLECSLSDVGKNTYSNLVNAGVQFFTVGELEYLVAEPDFYTIFNITSENNITWALCEVACSFQAPTRPTFNLLTGSSGSRAVGDTSFLTHFADNGAINAVPIPAAAWLFGSGLLGVVGVARRK